VLKVDRLATERLAEVSLAAFPGRVLGVYGLVGSGRSRFLRTLVGLERPVAGTIELEGRPFRPRDPEAAIAAGIAYLSEERKADGFVPMMSPPANVTLPVLTRFARAAVLNRGAMARTALEWLRRVQVRGRLDGPIADLSGGNQQKTLFARALLEQPRLLLLDQPTKGVDIGAKAEIHRIVRDLAATGSVRWSWSPTRRTRSWGSPTTWRSSGPAAATACSTRGTRWISVRCGSWPGRGVEAFAPCSP
jgi:ribose transport system ATP-binding protein